MKNWTNLFFTAWDLSKMDLKEYYPSSWAWAGMLMATIISLVIYWYTSMAFTPFMSAHIASHSFNYFTFIITAEMGLILPMLFWEAPTQIIKFSVSSGALHTLLQLPCSYSTPIIVWSLAKAPTEILRIFLNFFLIQILFASPLGVSAILAILFLTALSLPLFLGLGLLAAAIVVLFGRGEKILSFVVNTLSVFSGVFFPISVLPEFLQTLVRTSSPFYWIIERSRQAVAQSSLIPLTATEGIVLLVVGCAVFFLGAVSLNYAFYIKQRTGSLWILRY